MPRYVVITADTGHYYQGGEMLDLLGTVNDWATAFDYSDGVATHDAYGAVSLERQRTMHRLIHARSCSLPGAEEAFWREVLSAYSDAARWAQPHGAVAILLDHGDIGEVQLAPLHQLEVDLETLYGWKLYQEQHPHAPHAQYGPAFEHFMHIGALFRRHRIGHVDLLGCRIGMIERGQEFLDFIRYFWRVPVRALIGDLLVRRAEIAASGAQMAASLVVAPIHGSTEPGVRFPFPFDREYVATVPERPEVWRWGRARDVQVPHESVLRAPPPVSR
jgi:hypothetical protein